MNPNAPRPAMRGTPAHLLTPAAETVVVLVIHTRPANAAPRVIDVDAEVSVTTDRVDGHEDGWHGEVELVDDDREGMFDSLVGHHAQPAASERMFDGAQFAEDLRQATGTWAPAKRHRDLLATTIFIDHNHNKDAFN